MTARELLDHIETNVKTFTNCKLLGAGVAYHYTNHLAAIEAHGGFLGAPIDSNLAQTQVSIPSKPATHNPGVVFAYEDVEEAKLEGGKKCDIVEITYSAAVEATHEQEAEWADAPPCILMLTSNIVSYKLVRAAVSRPSPTTPSPTPPSAPPRSAQ